MPMRPAVRVIFLALLFSSSVPGSDWEDRFNEWPEDLSIEGRIIINNGLSDLEGAERTLRRVASGNVGALHS